MSACRVPLRAKVAIECASQRPRSRFSGLLNSKLNRNSCNIFEFTCEAANLGGKPARGVPRVREDSNKNIEMDLSTTSECQNMVQATVGHYDTNAHDFWTGTKDHDVTQNRTAFLEAMGEPLAGKRVLDFGSGPGRDVIYFRSLGLHVTALDGSAEFCRMIREHVEAAESASGCNAHAAGPLQILHQDFHSLELGAGCYDGVFANASLFHVIRSALPKVLTQLHTALVDDGVLFASNPRSEDDQEGFSGRYGFYMCYDTWASLMVEAGFQEINHYYRPPGVPRQQQPWLASTWRKVSKPNN
mmetsp:Transcript_1497/g.3121  ORF Transcript_1497/g.3121 Transcript_1497/m.3121 type:complete len:301 (+) Transcript_1497:198-1100(+)